MYSVFAGAGGLAVVVVERVPAHPGPHVPGQLPAVAPQVRHGTAVGAEARPVRGGGTSERVSQ